MPQASPRCIRYLSLAAGIRREYPVSRGDHLPGHGNHLPWPITGCAAVQPGAFCHLACLRAWSPLAGAIPAPWIMTYPVVALLPEKHVDEIIDVTFDFSPEIAAGETIVAQAVSVALEYGADLSPSALLSGSASVSGSAVVQRIGGGLAESVYRLRCLAMLSSGRGLTIIALLKVVA